MHVYCHNSSNPLLVLAIERPPRHMHMFQSEGMSRTNLIKWKRFVTSKTLCSISVDEPSHAGASQVL
eukprot:scaffold7488_cov37-Tisochrysis_lutea.AAC.4